MSARAECSTGAPSKYTRCATVGTESNSEDAAREAVYLTRNQRMQNRMTSSWIKNQKHWKALRQRLKRHRYLHVCAKNLIATEILRAKLLTYYWKIKHRSDYLLHQVWSFSLLLSLLTNFSKWLTSLWISCIGTWTDGAAIIVRIANDREN